MSIEALAYPVGKFKAPTGIRAAERAPWIEELTTAPELLRRAVEHLNDRQLDTRYRPAGWTVRQVVHHLPDSHLNAYIRYKLALTEDQPKVVSYDEAAWAELPEARTGPVALSVDLLAAVHQRWLASLRGLAPEQFERTYLHPEMGVVSLHFLLALYAWHGRHHVAQITSLATREGWTTRP